MESVRFPEGNKICYAQDFMVWEGLPSGVDFEVHVLRDRNSVKLVGPGYGAMYASLGDIIAYLSQCEGSE